MTAQAHIPAARSHAAWLAAATGAALVLAVFYPGFMSSDSAEQWLQARTGHYTSVHPPLMAMLWSVTDRLVPGPGGLFVLHTILLWAGLAWLGRGLFRKAWMQALFVLALGLWPPVLGTSVHLWKDVPMVSLVLLGVAALAAERWHPSRWRLASAVGLFALACAYRHNALTLVVPLLLYVVIRAGVPGWLPRVAATVVLTALVHLVASLPNRLPQVTQRQVWPVTAVWDLSALSIATEQWRIPADWRSPELSLDELRAAFRPWSNTTVFDTGKLRGTLYRDASPEQMSALRAAWLDAWRQEPFAMLRHRLRLTALLFGVRTDPEVSRMSLSPGLHPLPENPPLQLPASPLRDRVVTWLQAAAATPLFHGWLYLLILSLTAILAVRRGAGHGLLWPVLASAICLCLPLVLLAPSAEFRYLVWLPIATGIAVALLLQRELDGNGDGNSLPPRS